MTKPPAPPSDDRPLGPSADAPREGRQFTSAELFGDATEISIAHEQAVYRLRITRQGKLILNK